jgi:hypothetical protein
MDSMNESLASCILLAEYWQYKLDGRNFWGWTGNRWFEAHNDVYWFTREKCLEIAHSNNRHFGNVILSCKNLYKDTLSLDMVYQKAGSYWEITASPQVFINQTMDT